MFHMFDKLQRGGVYTIAEMSANHAGKLENALEIVQKAKDAGADCLKIQTYTADTITIDCRMNISQFTADSGTDIIFTICTRMPSLPGSGNPSSKPNVTDWALISFQHPLTKQQWISLRK